MQLMQFITKTGLRLQSQQTNSVLLWPVKHQVAITSNTQATAFCNSEVAYHDEPSNSIKGLLVHSEVTYIHLVLQIGTEGQPPIAHINVQIVLQHMLPDFLGQSI